MIAPASPQWLAALWLVPALALAFAWAFARQRRATATLAGRAGAGPVRWGVRVARAAAVVAAAALVIVALTRPRWDPKPIEVRRTGRDLVFVVDVSRSMLATDLAPTRLDRAKLWIGDLAEAVRGDRVALVAFAGTSVTKCPLTHDLGFFRLALDELSPESVARGGTLIGDALRRVADELLHAGRAADVILITDGEDHESFPAEAARALAERGARLIVLGLGSDEEGAAVPGVSRDGAPVISRMNPEALAQVSAAAEGGIFLRIGTGDIDLARVYRDLIAPARQNTGDAADVVRATEGFQYFIAAALALLALEPVVSDRRRAPATGRKGTRP